MKKYKHSKNTPERTGFYVALSVCMIAVGLAVWSAYTGLSDYLDTGSDEYFATLNPETLAAVAQPVTGVTEPDPTEKPTETSASAQPETQGKRGFSLSETLPDNTEDDDTADADSELTSLQAVLKVADSLIYPTKSRSVLKQYSEDAVYNKTMEDYRPHTGCDFEAAEGENVYAMCDGTVKNISSSELYGIIVEVDCTDFSVYYCGLSNELNVDKGDELKTGDTIGTVSLIPCECKDDSHVHIEIRVGNKLIDPLNVINTSE
ncbi:MAG: M23 family metallopeptidase [Ruminococcus sp.]|nr:M23 family metallopeptidase [Ruminococcus sp.]